MSSEFRQIGKIFETVPTFYKCADGALSTHNGRGACNYHGGLSSAKAIKLRRRCTPIATRTPTRQMDFFRKEDKDLFSIPLTREETIKPTKIKKQVNQKRTLKPRTTEGVKPAARSEFSEAATPQNLPLPSASATERTDFVVNVPLNDISISKKDFQNRKQDFSQRTVDNIFNDWNEDNFKWSNFDPITLWENENGKLFILSGHSRYEAFKRINHHNFMNLKIDGRDFKSIPSKIIRGISLKEAQQIALNSNTLSTKETDIERAVYYRNLRSDGATKAEVQKLAEKTEGRNAVQVIAFSFLNPNGKALNALMMLDNSNAASQGNARTLAKWIGEARQRFAILTDQHENELYDYLLSAGGYGRSKGQISKETDFLAKVNNILIRKGAGGMFNDFDPSKPLNIKNYQYKNQVERDYDEQLTTLKTEIDDLDKELSTKRRDLTRGGGTVERIIEITAGMAATLVRKQRAYQDLLDSKGKMLASSQSQQSLFVAGLRGIASRRSAARCIF